MSLSSATLSAIQKVGAAAFTADEKLKNAVKSYAERVNAAMVANPYGLGNDALFENWKTVARLSQTIAGIEEELRKVYRVASELTVDDQPTGVQVLALAAPTFPVGRGEGNNNVMTATDVTLKPKRKASPPKARPPKAKAVPSPAKLNGAAGGPLEFSGNAAKLLQHLERVLNANNPTVISQTAVGQATGIPLGSMTSAVKKLVEAGRIIAGPAGSFKLANAQTPLAA